MNNYTIRNGLAETINCKSTIIYFDPQPENEAIHELLDINKNDLIIRNNKTYKVIEIKYNIIDLSEIQKNGKEIYKQVFTKEI